MAWRSITISDVRLTPAEIAAMSNIQGAEITGEALLTNVIGEFRDTIAAAGTPLAVDVTVVPDLVRNHVINRARWLWLCEFPVLKAFQTADRSKLNDAAEKMLADISKRDVRVPPGDGSSADQSPSPSFGTRGGGDTNDPPARDFTKPTQEGL
jgi:hypothetical protein